MLNQKNRSKKGVA